MHRLGHGGVVEVWPTEVADDTDDVDPWTPLDESAARAPAERLAERIADTIRGWLDNGEMLASEGRRITAGDILILVRKRRPFAGPMVAALKARGIDVAGADRLRLSDQIAVADLVSLGEFLTLPEDDLSLAEVLKSPLIGFDDDDLLALAAGRKGTLWKSLIDHAGDNPRFQGAAETLKRWRSRADFVPPFEFFASILDREGGRAKLLARLGPEAADPIDEFLNLALSYDDNAPPSLTGFLTYLREADREVKRDMEHGRNEVRVMTVHGAKGLEAPIVFLPDTCSTATGGPVATLFDLEDLGLPEGADGKPFVWSVKGTSGHRVITAAKQERVRPRDRGAQPAAVRRHDARPRPALHRRLRRQERAIRRLLVRADQRRARRHAERGRRSRRQQSSPPPRAANGAAKSRARAPNAGRRRRLAAAVGDEPGAARAGAVRSARALASRSLRARRERRAAPHRAIAAATAQRGAAGAAAGRAVDRPSLPAWHADPRAAAAPADAAGERLGRRPRPATSRRAAAPCRRRRASVSPPRRWPSCKARSSRPCSGRRAGPRCRSWRLSPTRSARDRH